MQPAITDDQVNSLLPGCQRGEPSAIEELYGLYADRLYRYMVARLGDPDKAAELTTELFLRVIDKIARFRPHPDRPAATLSAWLYRIAANLVNDSHRQRGRINWVSLQEDRPNEPSSPSPHKRVEEHEQASMLASALHALSEDQRLVIVGKFGEDMSNAEIAEMLGKTEGAVKSLQHRALRTLGRIIGPGKRESGWT